MSTDAFAEAMMKAIGENADNQQVTHFIDTGFPPLNKIMSGRYDGGLPFGRLIEVAGESSTGKTALATAWMVQAQKMGGIAGFIDWERSFDVGLAESLGLSTTFPYWIYQRPRTWEDGNTLALKAVRAIRANKKIAPDAPILFVFDSIAQAVPASMADKDFAEFTMADNLSLSKVAGTTLKVMAQVADDTNSTFCYLNQIRLAPGVVYGDPRTTPGGKAMGYSATVRVFLGRQKIMEAVDGGKEFTGQIISMQAIKSKLTKPFQECSVRMTFDDDGIAHFDTTTSLLQYLVDKNLIPYTKPRITWTDGKQYFLKALAAKIDEEGIAHELNAFLPTKAETPAEAPAEAA